jgi:hypothetical protein
MNLRIVVRLCRFEISQDSMKLQATLKEENLEF